MTDLSVLDIHLALHGARFPQMVVQKVHAERVLAKLPEMQREMICLMAEGYPMTDMAAELGMSFRTLQRRIQELPWDYLPDLWPYWRGVNQKPGARYAYQKENQRWRERRLWESQAKGEL